MRSVYIVEAVRSPIGKTNGALLHVRPEKLLSQLISHMKMPKWVTFDDVLIATTVGLGGNLARLSVLESGLSMKTTAATLDFQCGGSLKALEYGFYSIASGFKDVVLVGGVESTSQEPTVILNKNDPKYHGPVPQSRGQFAPEAIGDPDMIVGAENCYKLLNPALEEIEDIVLSSHEKAVSASLEGLLTPFICPIKVDDDHLVIHDESVRTRMSRRLIQRAKPLVAEEGYSTAANSCLTHDGASLMILMSEQKMKVLGLKPLVEIIDVESVGINPNYSPLGAAAATKKLMKKNKLEGEAIAAVEVNEAFAIKTWSMHKLLGLDKARINPLGGALAYGHPYGATGGILMTHLIVDMQRAPQDYGIATMGVAGGQGIAVLVRKSNETVV
ncbi:MAG: thiolase family protein [Clostridia bacterium]|nr:thiolase family protein [Clostridia bacterium]